MSRLCINVRHGRRGRIDFRLAGMVKLADCSQAKGKRKQYRLVFSGSLLALADNLHKLGHNVAQHSFRQRADLAMNDLSA